MRFSRLSIQRCIVRAVLVATGLGITVGYAQEQGRKVEFSDQGAGNTSTNASKNSPEPSGFEQFKTDLFRPFESLDQRNSLNGVMQLPPPAQPRRFSVPDRHERELIERRKNWVFTDMNELYPQSGLKDPFNLRENGADGEEKAERSAIEKYYETQDQK